MYGDPNLSKVNLKSSFNIQSPFNRKLHMKFEENWPRGFRGGRSKVWKDDDRWQVITIAHPEHSSGELKGMEK